MNWRDVLNVALVVISSLGGGGLIVFGLSGFLGRIWTDRLKGEIDAKIHRLDARLEHGNFLLQRFAELELEAITECWRAARACLPALNATRPVDSGTEEAVLAANFNRLSATHNALLSAVGQHEPFWPRKSSSNSTRSDISHDWRCLTSSITSTSRCTWWEDGEKNRLEVHFTAHHDALLALVKARVAELREKAEAGLAR